MNSLTAITRVFVNKVTALLRTALTACTVGCNARSENCSNIDCTANKCGPGSVWLRAGRSGDRIPVGAGFSTPVQTGPGAHPASCTMDTGSFPRGKERPGRDADHSPPSSAVVMKE